MLGVRSLVVLLLSALSATCVAAADDATVLVDFEVNFGAGKKGTISIEVHPDWAPLGAARFLELVDSGFFTGVRFFRAIKGFMAQFGISGNPEIAAEWRDKKLLDDPVTQSNTRSYLSFATSGKDSRTTQIFINLSDNKNLDGMGFAPFAIVVGGDIDLIHTGYGEGGSGDGSDGKGPSQGRLQSEGNKYLKKTFPRLSYIESASRRVAPAAEL